MNDNQLLTDLAAAGRRKHGGRLPDKFTIIEQPSARTPDHRWKGVWPYGTVTAPTREAVEDHLFVCALNAIIPATVPA